jgi:hypothetical protein
MEHSHISHTAPRSKSRHRPLDQSEHADLEGVMSYSAHCSVLVALAFGSVSACTADRSVHAATEPAPPPPSQPDLRIELVYDRVTPSLYAGGSRFVLYGDGTFDLQYAIGGYSGRYSRADSTLAFQFDALNTLGPWRAVGAVHGDTLAVKFNDFMQMTDFEDGAYVRP